MQKIIPSDEPAEDTAFVDEQVNIWWRRGVQLNFTLDSADNYATISAFAYLNGGMYCSAYGQTRRWVLERCIAQIVAGQLQGLVIDPPSLVIKTMVF